MLSLKKRLILRQGLKNGIVAGILSPGTADGIEKALFPEQEARSAVIFEELPPAPVDPINVLIGMAKLADGNGIMPCGKEKEFRDCVTEPMPGVLMLWYDVMDDDSGIPTTKVQYISYDKNVVL
jgi:hypothetical protein